MKSRGSGLGDWRVLAAAGFVWLLAYPVLGRPARRFADPARLHRAVRQKSAFFIPSSLTVPVGETRKLPVMGAAGRFLNARVENPRVCGLRSSKIPFLLVGLHPGRTKIDITGGAVTRSTRVTVMERAGRLPQYASLTVTGDEVPKSFLLGGVRDVLSAEIFRRSGSRLLLKIPQAEFPAALKPGRGFEIPVKAEILGAHLLPVRKVLTLSVENRSLDFVPASRLMVSNDPESFDRPETLFSGRFLDGSPVRFFYHHVNKGSVAYLFEVILKNTGEGLSVVHVMKASAGPDSRELLVGARAGARFFDDFKHNLGQVERVGSSSAVTLVRTKVGPGGVVSGILRLSPLDAGAGSLRITARARALPRASASLDGGPESTKVSGPVFDSPEINVEAAYSAGGCYTFITLGRDLLLQDEHTDGPDLGNYGVFYTVHLTLKNPTASAAPVRVVFMPEAGPAEGVFLIDGRTLIKTPGVPEFHSYPLLALRLKPGEIRNVEIQTMPLGGSFYPVKLVVEP